MSSIFANSYILNFLFPKCHSPFGKSLVGISNIVYLLQQLFMLLQQLFVDFKGTSTFRAREIKFSFASSMQLRALQM